MISFAFDACEGTLLAIGWSGVRAEFARDSAMLVFPACFRGFAAEEEPHPQPKRTPEQEMTTAITTE